MARLDDLIAQVPDPRLRREIEAALAEMKRRQRFGLVFEEHVPETMALYGLPVQVGSLVQKRDDTTAKTLYRVTALRESTATVEPTDGGSPETAPVANLLIVKRFGEPIYPALTPLGSIRRGPADKPHHAVINGENYHALQLLLYLYEGQVDCIYIDPPYNTGARDWTYNNRYVDSNDAWRHSKWLSMMQKRLLRPDGVLIVTTDEHEVHHLGVLLEQIFPEASRQMVTIVINQKGVAQGRLSRVEEYAFFCFNPGFQMEPYHDDLLSPDRGSSKRPQEPRWERLLRGGANSRRDERPGLFYPIYVDPEKRAITRIGDPLPLEQMPDLSNVGSRVVAWPLRTDKSLGRWRVSPSTLRTLLASGYVRLGGFDEARGTWTVLYLGEKAQNQVVSGVLQLTDRDEVTGEVQVQYAQAEQRSIKTVWHRASHEAGNYGSTLLRNLLGEGGLFAFPKSLYAVRDALGVVVRNRPDAIVVDFFAGSGTTLHATCLLNAEDDGRRRCVLVTNNEVSEDRARTLNRQDCFRGDPKYEACGVFERVARPRCETTITGRRPDGSPVPGSYLDGRTMADGFEENVEFYRLDYLDPDEVDLGRQFEAILPSLWLAAGGIGDRGTPTEGQDFTMPAGSTYGVLFKESRFRRFLDALEACSDVTHVWLVTDSEEAYAEMRSALPQGIRASMLYRDYLRNFRINTERNL
jgi:adenine-specific DNA-methyltransferase